MKDLEKKTYLNVSSLFTKDGTAYKNFGISPTTLVFIQGVGMCADIWQPQVEYFSKHYRVITYDFFGHGQSALKKNKPSISDYVEQLNNLVNEIGVLNFSLIGHSMGAIIAVAFALRYPKKVKTLIPINIVFKRTREAKNAVLKRADDVLRSGKITNIDQTINRWFKNKSSVEELVKVNNVSNWLQNTPPKGYSLAYHLFATSDRIFENNLSKLLLPVLYLAGSEDLNSTSLMSKQMSQETPNSIFECVEGEAHMMSYIAAEKVNPIIAQFLNNNKNTAT